MNDPIIIIGMGEIGSVLARGLLRAGHPVYPVTRAMQLSDAHRINPEPMAVVLAVAEAQLQTCLHEMPTPWRNKLVLLQNELLPRDWEEHNLQSPTVMSVWFEKKKGMDSKVLLPSPLFGHHAGLISTALLTLDVPTREVLSMDAMTWELVRKNVYILTTNIAGLAVGGTVEELWQGHEALTRAIADEVIQLQEALTGLSFEREALIQGMLEGFHGDPAHKCMGRTAPARLERALNMMQKYGISAPTMQKIASKLNSIES
ncbi:MAG TPA: hypothetical protein ENO09_02430 [bacterium]|nr:hypothetical protein [bacterium]